jgi:hypothetical protein
MSESHWVHALTIGGETSPEQRQRNLTVYQRLKDGALDVRGNSNGLSAFCYDVPIERLRMGPGGKSFSFVLNKNDECFARLLNVIADHFDSKCDADDKVALLEEKIRALSVEIDRLRTPPAITTTRPTQKDG